MHDKGYILLRIIIPLNSVCLAENVIRCQSENNACNLEEVDQLHLYLITSILDLRGMVADCCDRDD